VSERGWDWTASEIRRVQLLEWVAEQSVARLGEYIEVKAFYDARPDQSENTGEVAFDDLTSLTEARLILSGSGIGGIESLAAMLTAQGHDLLEQLRAQRAHKSQRSSAARPHAACRSSPRSPLASPPTGEPTQLATWELEAYVYERLARQLRAPRRRLCLDLLRL
jgi:hypothetical protein